MTSLLAMIVALLVGPARAGKLEDLQYAELERTRARIANQVHLATFDLVDEMVHGWLQEPPFPQSTPVVVASVTVPVGLGTGLASLVENHLASALVANPRTNVRLVHCPTCTQVTVHSSPNATVIARGIDNPAVWAELGSTENQHALFVDIEAEGAFLVLRARLTLLDPELPIVWSRTLTTSADAPALLRSPQDLKSASDAREEYLDALRGRARLSVPLRLAFRNYRQSDRELPVPAPPMYWLQSGIEAGTRARDWTGSIIVGGTFAPQIFQGFMVEARVHRLIGRLRSSTRPNVYFFFSGGLISLTGPGSLPFNNERLTAEQLLNLDLQLNPRSSFGIVNTGFDVRLGNRIGLSGFLEWMPSLANSPNIGSYIRLGPVRFSAFGLETSLWL